MKLDMQILDRLLRASAPIEPTTLGRELGLSTAQVLRRVEALGRAGCEFETHPQRGLRLAVTGLGCWADYLEPRHAGALGRKVVVYRQTASTQDAARKLLKGPDPADRVVVADHQSAGRGRLGRKWLAPAGSSLLMTAVVRLPVSSGELTLDRLMLASCCAVAQTVESLGRITTQIRWPNDILIDARKLAGVLIETVGGHALIGIGLNIRPVPPPPGCGPVPPTSLAEHHVDMDRLGVLDALLTELHVALHQRTSADLHAAWRRRSCLLQQRVTVETDGRRITGRVLDLDPCHGLILSDDRSALHTLPAATTSLMDGKG